jgi:hypothetical protein
MPGKLASLFYVVKLENEIEIILIVVRRISGTFHITVWVCRYIHTHIF